MLSHGQRTQELQFIFCIFLQFYASMDVTPLLLMWLESLFKHNPGYNTQTFIYNKTEENDTTQRMYTSNFKHFCFYCQMDAVFFYCYFAWYALYNVHGACCVRAVHAALALTRPSSHNHNHHHCHHFKSAQRTSKRIKAKRQHNKKEKKKTEDKGRKKREMKSGEWCRHMR